MTANEAHDCQDGPTLAALAADLRTGRRTSRQLVEECLSRIDGEGEGARRAFVAVSANEALATAEWIDRRRAANAALPAHAGIPISIKDLFDVAGQVTSAGSRVLADGLPAEADAAVVARLKKAGFILIGRTNMTEFAYSGLGLNPHFGTPVISDIGPDSPIPGGSSSGAAVSVRLGMAHGSIGTDTGGSCRIPAAFCDLVGFKPTAGRVPRHGCIPLSTTLDSIGPIARSVGCCAVLDGVMAGEEPTALATRELSGVRLAVPTTVVMEDLDVGVAAAFERVLDLLSRHGAHLSFTDVPEFTEARQLNAEGGLAAIESFAWHRRLLDASATLYDPRVLALIQRGANVSAADYIELFTARASLMARARARLSAYDALVMPTVPVGPPRLKDLDDPADYDRLNRLVLRNPFLINMIDGCAISLPVRSADGSSYSISIAGVSGSDRAILEIAQGLEAVVNGAVAPVPPRSHVH